MKKLAITLSAALIAASAFAARQFIGDEVWECDDDAGVCKRIGTIAELGLEEEAAAARAAAEAEAAPEPAAEKPALMPARHFTGYAEPDEFLAFLEGRETEANTLAGKSLWLVLALVLLGGLAMNLTPCVLPMMPINLMIIGRSALRGALYGLGLALAYGTLGLAAAFFGLTFGAIQGNPWFNAAICVIFILLGLALAGAFMIDLSKKRGGASALKSRLFPGLFAFFMGVVSAVLAGACVAPILIAVLLQSAALSAEGHMVLAVALPFVLGLGMALPWPVLGAGIQVLPKPGNWMKWVNRVFAVIVFGFAAWYARLAWIGFRPAAEPAPAKVEGVFEATPATAIETLGKARAAGKPVFVDCWATWCKNCLAMEDSTFKDPKVAKALEGFTILKIDVTNDPSGLGSIPGFEETAKGYPAFFVFE